MKKSKNNNIIWVLVFGFTNLVSVDAKERSKDTKIFSNSLFIFHFVLIILPCKWKPLHKFGKKK